MPSAGLWAHRLGDQRAKRLLLTGDCLSGKEAAEWGLAVESAPAEELDERTENLVQRIARLPINQLMMVKLAQQQPAVLGRRHQSDDQHRLRRGVPAHP